MCFVSMKVSNLYSFEAIKEIMATIAEDWLRSKDEEERSIMIMWAQRTRIIVTCGYFIMGMGFVSLIILPLVGISITDIANVFDTDRLLPLPAYHIYGLTKSPQYEIVYLLQIVVIFVCGISFTGIDNFLGLLVFHICGQLGVLRSRLIHMNKLMKIHNLKSCVITHIRLLRYSIIIYHFIPFYVVY